MDFSDLRDAHLLGLFSNFSGKSIRLMPFLTTMVIIQDILEEELKNNIRRIIGNAASNELVDTTIQWALSQGSAEPLSTRSIKDLQKIAAEINACSLSPNFSIKHIVESAPQIYDMAAEYISNYDFLSTDYYMGRPLNIDDVISQAIAIKDRCAVSEDQQRPQCVTASLEKDIIDAAQIVCKMHFLRQYRIEALFKSGRDARGLFEEIGARIGVCYDEFVMMTASEIFDSLSDRKLSVQLSTIHDRMAGYGISMVDGVCEYIVGEKLETARKNLALAVPTDTILKGVTAYPGQYEGSVHVVDHVAETFSIKQGDILVAPMTSPYHVPAMTVAGAVITTEGGILSHAAILCRELRIPCIVGVSSALDVLKNGDKVRVEATPSQGRVTLISN